MDHGADNLGNAGADLRIGGLRINGRAILTPMSGVTDLGMRRMASRFGAAFTVTEMVATEGFARGDAANLKRKVWE
jgi:tRNA-dihydrouridine synthase B